MRVALAIVVLLAAGIGALYYHGSTLKAKSAPVEKVIPNDRFPQ
jgi:hypothetical protein